MKPYSLLTFLSLLPLRSAIGSNSTVTEESSNCRGLHSQAYGVNLVCCGGSAGQVVEDCEYAQQCSMRDECTCSLTVNDQLNCTEHPQAKAFTWKDHSPAVGLLECHRPNLPNDSKTLWEIQVDAWNNRTAAFLLSLCSLNVTSLTLKDSADLLKTWDLTKCMPHLSVLEIALKQVNRLDIYQLFRSLRWLRALRLVNVDFDFWHSTSPWVSNIAHLHIENSSLRELPKWLSSATQLKRLFVQGTRLFSVETVGHMRHLHTVKLAKNEIGNLTNVAFRAKDAFDIDLSYNKIAEISAQTFASCTDLRVLDLSNNPLETLPINAFVHNTKLKWLKLDYTRITTLLPEHFTGLIHLRTLTVSHTPLHRISPFSFLPLKSLRVLGLNSCNLTEVPHAVTQLCHLTHLNLAHNLLRDSPSLSPEVIVHLSSLSQLNLEGNPLKEFPSGLLMLSPMNTRLVRDTVRSLTVLPLWTEDPCTPFYFHMHLTNSTPSLRQLVLPWNLRRMKEDGLTYCKEQFDVMKGMMQVYRDIGSSSACAVSRRLRSPDECIVNTTTTPRPHHRAHPLQRNLISNRIYDPSPSSTTCPIIVDTSHAPLLYLSVALNAFFITGSCVLVCLCCVASSHVRY